MEENLVHDTTALTLARARRLSAERLTPAIELGTVEVEITSRTLPGEPEPFADAVAGSFAPFELGAPWGPAWSTTWFRLRGSVPEEWRGRRVEIVVDLGFDADAGPGFQAEGLAFAADGRYLKGIEPRNQYITVVTDAEGGEAVDIYVEAAANPDIIAGAFRPTDLGDRLTAPDKPLYVLKRAALTTRDQEVQALVVDLDIVTGLIEQLAPTDPQRGRLTAALSRACDAILLNDVRGTAAAARAALAPALSGPAARSAHRVSAIGHAHIDSAWLWPTRETVRKVSRTFSNVLALMEDYPELLFVASSAQQYAWLRDRHPALFERVRERVAEGRFIPIGGMWVESDTNMPGGEALVRQFTQGTRFFREQFGVDSDVLWLPDSFGYTAALPQIARLAGMRSFVTQKLAWQPVNRFPHHTFEWEGIDGSRLLAHMPPVDSYLSELTPAELAYASRNHRDHHDSSSSIVPFGHGDGGGGPTALMMERARRQADLEGSPTVAIETPQQFFRTQVETQTDLPVWVGELYLEGHRGTYTSQAAMKRGNRRSEHLMREAELWSTLATVRAGADYPYDELDGLWQRVLLNQFHDILPGSSIAWVHREAREQYEGIAAEAEAVIERAITALAGVGDRATVFDAVAGSARPADPDAGANASLDAPVDATGHASETVASARGTSGLPSVTETADGTLIDNGALLVGVDRDGRIARARDLRADRELVPAGEELGGLAVHTDLPNAFDAWDLDEFYRATRRPLSSPTSVSVGVEDRTVVIDTEYHLGDSTLRRRATIAPDDPAIGFELAVDWQERETILKAEFPLDVKAESARSEIQFGYIDRPITNNTSWEAQKFEVSAHRWVHVGEPGYGVAIVNDSTYGHDFRRQVFGDGRPGVVARLSILRSPSFPDPAADRGEHVVRYRAVFGASVLDATDEGLRLNLGSRTVQGSGADVAALATASASARISAIKLADDRSGDVVVRLYEAAGQRSHVRVGLDASVVSVRQVDLHERPLDDGAVFEGSTLELDLAPFEIVTLRATRATLAS
jgi:alpha-mannosidase